MYLHGRRDRGYRKLGVNNTLLERIEERGCGYCQRRGTAKDRGAGVAANFWGLFIRNL